MARIMTPGFEECGQRVGRDLEAFQPRLRLPAWAGLERPAPATVSSPILPAPLAGVFRDASGGLLLGMGGVLVAWRGIASVLMDISLAQALSFGLISAILVYGVPVLAALSGLAPLRKDLMVLLQDG